MLVGKGTVFVDAENGPAIYKKCDKVVADYDFITFQDKDGQWMTYNGYSYTVRWAEMPKQYPSPE